MFRNLKRAFSVLELLVASSMFLFLLFIVFFFFRYGTRAFATANQRQGVQAESLRVMDSLQADLKRTASQSVMVLNDLSRTRSLGTATVHRDAICLISLKDWSSSYNPENFDESGSRPRWNRYWVYYATTDEDRGAMVRLKVDPEPAPVSPTKMQVLHFYALCNNNPALNNYGGVTPAYSYLCHNVYDFRASREGNNSFRISLKLQEKRQLRPDGGKTDGLETFQLQMVVRPENTYPQDLTDI